MRALVKTKVESGNIELRDVPKPEPTANQVRIKVKRAGICQTDIVYIKEGGFALKPPVILGHEVSGVIDAVGSEVKSFKIGDRVISQTTHHVCGNCRYCKKGLYNHCAERKGIGSAADGAFAEYLVNWEESIMLMPDDVTFDQGAAVEPLACGVHALTERMNVCVDSVVVVLGPGAIGLFVAQVAKAQGAYVIIGGLTQDAERLELALKLGIDKAVDIQKENIMEIVKSVTEGFGADVVIEATGAKAAVDLAMNLAARRGTFIPMGVFNNTIDIDFHTVKKKELDVYGSHAQIPTSWHKALKMIQNGKVNVDAMISHVYPLSKWEEALEIVANRKGVKVMLNPEE